MAFRCINLFRNIKCRGSIIIRHNLLSTSISKDTKINEVKEFRTENNLVYIENPECFGTLAGRPHIPDSLHDEGDVKEEQYLQNIPIKSQKLSIKQYADLIKQYLKYKRINEAIDVLETRMLKEDRVKPENYIYNILIGACAEVGYTKKAFKLFNDMKRRALKPRGDTYTCLFEACINSPWSENGLKMATYLRNHMIEKGIEPNLTNYNVMIKAFGRCADISTAFKIVDEMISKKIKIRVHTFNHLLHACISDKESGLKHALIVWRKMLKMREKPNIYSFNLMLKCVKECNLRSKEDILEVISLIQEHMALLKLKQKALQIANSNTSPTHSLKCIGENINNNTKFKLHSDLTQDEPSNHENVEFESNKQMGLEEIAGKSSIDNDITSFELVENYERQVPPVVKRTTLNLLSKFVQIDNILGLKEIYTPQEKFALIGGQEDFLKEMEVYLVKPDIKTFTQMLPLIADNTEAENILLDTLQKLNIKTDIDFYNALIKKRCLRQDYDSALEVTKMIEKENKRRKRHPFNKKYNLKVNIITYGVLALGCKTKEAAGKLLNEMKDKQLKINIEILGTLLKNATFQMQFGYILYIMDTVKIENIKVNDVFIKHLETFNDRCLNIIEQNKQKNKESTVLMAAYHRFSNIYNNWLKEVNVEEAIKPEHPWKQFMEPHPTSVQRESIKIVQPQKFYKRNRKFVRYRPKLLT